MTCRTNFLLIALACLLDLGFLAIAEAESLACNADTAGQLSVQASVRCECQWSPEGLVTGRAAGYRWNCSVLQARMNHSIPADLNAYQGNLWADVLVPGLTPEPVAPPLRRR